MVFSGHNSFFRPSPRSRSIQYHLTTAPLSAQPPVSSAMWFGRHLQIHCFFLPSDEDQEAMVDDEERERDTTASLFSGGSRTAGNTPVRTTSASRQNKCYAVFQLPNFDNLYCGSSGLEGGILGRVSRVIPLSLLHYPRGVMCPSGSHVLCVVLFPSTTTLHACIIIS
jgi:hypothetical protein